MRTFDDICFTPYGYSFLGQKVFSNDLIKWNFINNNGDTLKIKSDAQTNDNWLFYMGPQSDLQIIATIDSISEYSFIDLTDSVKYISFQAQNLSGVNTSHPINNKKLVLSKHYGFVSIFKFDDCPSTLTELKLLGIKSLQKGNVDFGAEEVWSMEIGDEFHEMRSYSNYGSWYDYGTTDWYIRKVISKSINADSSITYNYLMLHRILSGSSIYGMEFLDSIYPPYISSTTPNYANYSKFNTTPGGLFLDTLNYFKEAYIFEAGYSPSKLYFIKQSLIPNYDYYSDSCYKYPSGFPHTENKFWTIKGTGRIYNYSYDTDGGTYAVVSKTELKYYKKGNTTWGTPFSLVFPPLTEYQCIKTESEHFYYNPNENREAGTFSTESISIDSTYEQNGLTYYQNHLSMRQAENDCFTPYGYSFLGQKVFSDTTGFFYFVNNENDTLRIKSNAAINESWVFLEDTDNALKIIARVDSVRNQTFKGIKDEIKYISFQAFSMAGDTLSHPVNSETMILSQDHGFVRMFRFDVCPMEISVLELCGDTDTGHRITNVGPNEIFNLNPGDEIHDEFFFQENKPAANVYTRNQYIRKLISKTGSFDSVMTFTYDILEHQVYYNSGSGYGQDTLFPHYTKEVTVDFNDPEITKWNSLPGEAYTDSIQVT